MSKVRGKSKLKTNKMALMTKELMKDYMDNLKKEEIEANNSLNKDKTKAKHLQEINDLRIQFIKNEIEIIHPPPNQNEQNETEMEENKYTTYLILSYLFPLRFKTDDSNESNENKNNEEQAKFLQWRKNILEQRKKKKIKSEQDHIDLLESMKNKINILASAPSAKTTSKLNIKDLIDEDKDKDKYNKKKDKKEQRIIMKKRNAITGISNSMEKSKDKETKETIVTEKKNMTIKSDPSDPSGKSDKSEMKIERERENNIDDDTMIKEELMKLLNDYNVCPAIGKNKYNSILLKRLALEAKLLQSDLKYPYVQQIIHEYSKYENDDKMIFNFATSTAQQEKKINPDLIKLCREYVNMKKSNNNVENQKKGGKLKADIIHFLKLNLPQRININFCNGRRCIVCTEPCLTKCKNCAYTYYCSKKCKDHDSKHEIHCIYYKNHLQSVKAKYNNNADHTHEDNDNNWRTNKVLQIWTAGQLIKNEWNIQFNVNLSGMNINFEDFLSMLKLCISNDQIIKMQEKASSNNNDNPMETIEKMIQTLYLWLQSHYAPCLLVIKIVTEDKKNSKKISFPILPLSFEQNANTFDRLEDQIKDKNDAKNGLQQSKFESKFKLSLSNVNKIKNSKCIECNINDIQFCRDCTMMYSCLDCHHFNKSKEKCNNNLFLLNQIVKIVKYHSND